MRIFKSVQGIVGDYDYNRPPAVITRYKLLYGTSSYRGGTKEYLNSVRFKLGPIHLYHAWSSEEYNV